jgi:hypothetical protein
MTMNPDDKAVPLTQDEGIVAIVQGHDGAQLVQGNVVGARQARQSHLCCGCCCDTRRAVMVVNVLGICLAILSIASISRARSARANYAFDDDEYQYSSSEIDDKAVGLSISVLVVGMFCQVSGFYGAHKFKKIGTTIGAVWHALECIRSIVFYDFAGAIMSGFFCYPHVVFLQELKNGIMTPEKYPNEELCCACCV